VLDDPGWCPDKGGGHARGEGDLVGDSQVAGDGEGVLARGERGMCPTDFLLLGECSVFDLTCSLCFKPCRDEGRADGELVELAGEQGADESPGLEESDRNASTGKDCNVG